MQTKDIKQKIGAVKNIGKITKTMEMVSVAKMRRAVTRATTSKKYANLGMELLRNIALDKDVRHPYVDGVPGAVKELYIVVASNKGLCGAFNVNVSRRLLRAIKDKKKNNIEVISIGRQAERVAFRLGLKVVASFNEFGDQVTIEDVIALQMLMDKMYKSNDYRKVKLVYTKFIKSMSYEPSVVQLLPFKVDDTLLTEAVDEKKAADYRLYTFEPSMTEILTSIVPGLLQSVLVQIILDSVASEHSSRMVAMKGASDNANSLLEDLKLSFNKARQEAITREISEIAAGADAVN